MDHRPARLIRGSGCAAVLCAALAVAPAGAQEAGPIRLGQGEVVVFSHHAPEAARVRGRFYDRAVPFFRGSAGMWLALLGADLNDPPGHTEFLLELMEARDPRIVRVPIEVKAAGFGTQTLTLPKHMVDPDAKTLARVKAEQARVSSLLDRLHPERLWRGPFLLPTDGRITQTFGMRRLLNGEPRSPHSGEDIVAPKGTPIRAAQHGIVRLAETHFFSGRSLILDHGLGLYTLYFHLSEAAVQEGAVVKQGQVIGKVGATGRVTGPHLHWGAVLGGARVNPLNLLALPSD